MTEEKMTRIIKRRIDPAVSEVIGTILMVALTVLLAAIVSAYVMGLVSNTPEPSYTAFITKPVYNNTTNKIDAISIICMAGENVSGKSGGTSSSGGNSLQDISIFIGPQGGNQETVTLCANFGPNPFNITPGTLLYIINRTNTYYLVTSPSQKDCDGSGPSQQNKPNGEFLPHGIWKVIISDTLKSNTIIYNGEVQL